MQSDIDDPHGITRVGLRIAKAIVDGDGDRLVREVAEHIDRSGLIVSPEAVELLVCSARRHRQ